VIWTVGVLVVLFQVKGLNALLAGNEYLVPLGISMYRLKWSIIAVTAIITGGLTAFVGPIAFVGLAVPHISRLLFREVNHRVQVPATLMLGASLLLLCDTIAQVPGSSMVLPINAITSLFGAPVVIWLIVKRRRIRM
jgi:iron complex transport system permease protein